MPKIKDIKRALKHNFEKNYFCDSEPNEAFSNSLQNSENSNTVLLSVPTFDTSSCQFQAKANSESPQKNHPHEDSNEHLQWDQTCESSNSRFETETSSEVSENSVTSFHENSNEQMQWEQTGETVSKRFETKISSNSESKKKSLANSHENSNEQMQWEQNCEMVNDRFETEADSMPDQSSDSTLQSNVDCETGNIVTQNCRTNFQLENSQIHKNKDDLPRSSEDFQENQDYKTNILLEIKIEPPDHNSSNSNEYQNNTEGQNHLSDSIMEDLLNIKTETCDINSLNYKKHSQLANEQQIKSELCDINSDPLGSECSTEIKSHSESSFEACDRQIDHSSSSSTVEVKSEKPDPENDAASPPNLDLKRSRRNSKRKREVEEHCPVCGLTVRYSDLESHFAKEVENLSNIAKNVRKNRLSNRDKEDFRNDFVQVKYNRENRLAARIAKYAKKQEISCPVCKLRISGTDQEINDHVLGCFGEDDDSDINVTDCDEYFEEYEIGDETRIRAISLVPGGHSALHGYSSKSKSTNDDDDDGVDVNVDIDDTVAFGEPQYTELDVIHNKNEASNEKEEQLRRAVVSNPCAEPHIIQGKKWSQDCDIQNDIDEIVGSYVKNNLKDQKSTEENDDMKVEHSSKKVEKIQNTESRIISSLKERIKDLEQQKNVKCLICLEPYTRPLVSTTCWHVYCEECWLVSMGVKKLCPQCNMIVFPTDLRRIYL